MGTNKTAPKAAATISLLMCQTIYMFYVSARAVTLPAILSSLGGMSYYSITIILSAMTTAVFTPLAGRLGDTRGRKQVYLLGLPIRATAFIICALAPNHWVLMAGIALTGVGNGMSYPQCLALVTDLYPPEKQPTMLSYISVLSAVSGILGPLVGGLCTDYLSWRWLFVLLLPLELLNICCALIGIPNVPKVAGNVKIDYLGTLLFATCMMPFLYTLTAAGSSFGWISPQTMILMSISVVAGVLLFRQENRVSHPIIPLPLFKKKIFRLCVAITLCAGLCFSVTYYLPIYYQVIKHMSVTTSGLMGWPRQIGTILLSIVIGQYYGKTRNFRRGTTFAAVVMLATLFVMSSFNAITPLAFILAAEFCFGTANGVLTITPGAIGQFYLSREDMGSGLAFISLCGTLGSSLGSAITGSIVGQFWNVRRVLPDQLISALSEEQITMLGSTTVLRDAAALAGIQETLPTTLHAVFETGTAALVSALNKGISVAFFSYAVMLLLLAVAVVRFPWKDAAKSRI